MGFNSGFKGLTLGSSTHLPFHNLFPCDRHAFPLGVLFDDTVNSWGYIASMEHGWNDTDREQPNLLQKNLSNYIMSAWTSLETNHCLPGGNHINTTLSRSSRSSKCQPSNILYEICVSPFFLNLKPIMLGFRCPRNTRSCVNEFWRNILSFGGRKWE